MALCMFCAAELHFECSNSPDGLVCCCPETTLQVANRAGKDAEAMRDVLSTGRKRAAIAAPIQPDTVCEWAKRKNAGGGVKPIVGCMGNKATDRHHGPDKSVLNNELGSNLHRICATCHNRWHTLNDPEYGERPEAGAPFLPLTGQCLPHDPEQLATDQEIFQNELYWGSRKDKTA